MEQASLVNWVNTFDGLSHECNSILDLCDGILLFEIMEKIDPASFDSSCLKRDVEDSWPFKFANLKTLLSNIEVYYRETLLQRCVHTIDPGKVCRDEDEDEIIKLVELVLGAVVQCETKQEYIGKIMTMDKTSQGTLMRIIQQTMETLHERSQDVTEPSSYLADLDEADGMFSHLTNGNAPGMDKHTLQLELDLQHAVADKLKVEEALTQLRQELQTCQDDLEHARTEKSELAIRVNQLTEQSVRAAAVADANKSAGESEVVETLRRQLIEQNNAVTELTVQLQRAEKFKEEAVQLRDENDVLKARVDALQTAEASLAKAKKKLEESVDLRKQLKALEEQNTQYVDKMIELEDEVKTIPDLNQRLASYKAKLAAIETGSTTAASLAGDRDKEMKALREECEKAIASERSLRSELRRAQEQVEELQEAAAAVGLSDGGAPLEAEGMTADVKIKLARLEKENKALREGQGSSSRVRDLEDQLDDSQRVRSKLQERVSDLERQLSNSSTSTASGGGGGDGSGLEAEAIAMLARNSEKLKKEVKEVQIREQTLVAERDKLKEENKTFMEAIQRLNDEKVQLITQHEESLELSLSTLKTQLSERDESIQRLKRSKEESTASTEQEMQLMMTALYSEMMEVERCRGLRRNPSTPMPSSSWLGRQRQKTPK